MSSRVTGPLTVIANLAAFSACACLAFARNINALFYHYDGSYLLVDARNQLNFGQPIFDYTNNFLQSIGNIQLPQNVRLLPFLWPIGWFSNPQVAKIACYLILAAIVFLTAYGLARLLSQSRTVALTAGWILGFVATPFMPILFFYAILSVAPPFVVIAVTPVVAFCLILRGGRSSSLLADAATVLGLVALAFYALVAVPLLLPIVALGTAIFVVLALFLARRRSELLRKLAILAAVLVVATLLRWPWYALGLFLNTAPNFFPNDYMVVYHDATFSSILFHSESFGWAGPLLVASSAVGAILSLRSVDFELRSSAWMLLGLIATFIGAGIALAFVPHWILPPPIYLEIAVWPLYGVFAAIALHRIVGFVVERFARLKLAMDYRVRAEFIVPAAVMVFAAVLVMRKSPTVVGYPFPPRISPVVAILRDKIALESSSKFNGRILTVMPVKAADDIDAWSQQFRAAYEWAQTAGNDEMSVGLWYFRVPTLFEYNQFLSPAFHVLLKRALQRPPIVHPRNITILTYPNARVLKLLGVRYVLMPQPDASLGELRATEDRAGVPWGLIELAEPNLATYSPTSIETRRDLTSALDFVVDDRVDLTKRAVTASPVVDVLVPVQSSTLAMANEDLHIVAKSAGRSLVVVPVEFSHCVALHELRLGTRTGTALLRVDGVLTGIVFEHELDAVLSFRIGPLHNPLCRWQDYQDLRAMLHELD
jgi:hypothetical protein